MKFFNCLEKNLHPTLKKYGFPFSQKRKEIVLVLRARRTLSQSCYIRTQKALKFLFFNLLTHSYCYLFDFSIEVREKLTLLVGIENEKKDKDRRKI